MTAQKTLEELAHRLDEFLMWAIKIPLIGHYVVEPILVQTESSIREIRSSLRDMGEDFMEFLTGIRNAFRKLFRGSLEG